MQIFRHDDTDSSAIVGWGVRVLLLSATAHINDSKVGARLAGLGGLVELVNEPFTALNALIEAATGYGLFVIECDMFGGLAAAQNLVSMLHRGGVLMPVVLVSSECSVQVFPEERHLPVILRAPMSAVSLRVAFEHAMRDRLVFRTQ
jgi:hypothetical protein